VLVPLDEAQAKKALEELVAAGIQALAICLLWSFKHPEHEARLVALARRHYPDLFVVASSELIPILREYERANTTAINAFLGRVFQRYASGMRERLQGEGHGGDPLVMQSVGGLAPASEIEKLPIVTLFSGPVGGVIAGRSLGAMIGERNVITTDMGGTSFDVGLILDGEPLSTQKTVIERQIVAIPTVDIETVGAGGGSIARINESGLLQVGPRSMGAMPGPACYGRGGQTPTVTDADVVLGYIDAEHFLGGRMKISRERAEEAIRKDIAEPLGMSVVEAAAAIYDIVNARMADLIRRMTVERGHDPRDFVLAAFGGCGPTHSTAYGPDIGVGTVVVPESATAFSALGISQSDLRHSWVHSFNRPLRRADGTLELDSLDELNRILVSLFERAHAQFERDRIEAGRGRIAWSADLRYKNQVHELLVTMPIAVPLAPEALGEVVRRFESVYDRRYGAGASSPTARIEWVNVRVDALAPTRAATRLEPEPLGPDDAAAAKIGERPAFNLARRRYQSTPLYAAERLCPGHRVAGPAVILSYGTTVPLHDGQQLVVDAYRNYLIRFEEAKAA
jgi:N-methylhydantoinase A